MFQTYSQRIFGCGSYSTTALANGWSKEKIRPFILVWSPFVSPNLSFCFMPNIHLDHEPDLSYLNGFMEDLLSCSAIPAVEAILRFCWWPSSSRMKLLFPFMFMRAIWRRKKVEYSYNLSELKFAIDSLLIARSVNFPLFLKYIKNSEKKKNDWFFFGNKKWFGTFTQYATSFSSPLFPPPLLRYNLYRIHCVNKLEGSNSTQKLLFFSPCFKFPFTTHPYPILRVWSLFSNTFGSVSVPKNSFPKKCI